MKIDARRPFDMFKDDQWVYIKDTTNKEKYNRLDAIFRYFAGDIKQEELPEDLRGKSTYELEQYYNQHFTALLGEALLDIGANLVMSNPCIQYDFSNLQGYKKMDDKDVWYCTECGSRNVEIKQWVLPNSSDEPAGGDDLDRNDCLCQDCEDHTALEICDESRYPEILLQFQTQKQEQE